jgi:hypothetical protein
VTLVPAAAVEGKTAVISAADSGMTEQREKRMISKRMRMGLSR